jgi:hypothetical protein
MAITRTTLSAAIGATDLLIPVTSSTSFLVGQPVKIENEYIGAITAVPSTTSIVVRMRGDQGTAAIAHAILAQVETAPLASAATDFPITPTGVVAPIPSFMPVLVSVGANGVIPVPTTNTTIQLTKATALATTTLGAPSTANDGIVVTITNMTAAAHVITATGLISDGVTGGAKSTLTFGAFVGASIQLMAANGLWNVISAVVCPIT